MFVTTNFISGLKLFDRYLNVDIAPDNMTLVLSYTLGQEQHTIGEIPIEDINQVAEQLATGFSCSKAALCNDQDYFEVAVQGERFRRMPLRASRMLYPVDAHNYRFEVSLASPQYLFALFCSFAQQRECNYDMIPLPVRIRAAEKISSLSDLTELCRIFTVKIKSPQKHTRTKYEQMLDAYLFNISYNHNTALSVINFAEEQRLPRSTFRREGQLFPYKRYNPELVKYYHQAVSTNIPFAQYLAFYHVAEFFLQAVAEKDLFKQIGNHIMKPSFSPYSESDIRVFYEMIRKKMREQREDGVWNEKTALLLVLKQYVPDLVALKKSILSIDANAINYYKTNLAEFADDSKLIDFDETPDKIFQNIRDRVYSVRNAIVHSKDGERLRYEPFRHDKQLAKEIPLMQAISEEIIMNSAKEFDFYDFEEC